MCLALPTFAVLPECELSTCQHAGSTSGATKLGERCFGQCKVCCCVCACASVRTRARASVRGWLAQASRTRLPEGVGHQQIRRSLSPCRRRWSPSPSLCSLICSCHADEGLREQWSIGKHIISELCREGKALAGADRGRIGAGRR